MPSFLHPGAYVQEVRPSTNNSIQSLSTSVVGFVGKTEHIQKGDFDSNNVLHVPTRITSWAQYTGQYGGYDKKHSPYLALSVKGFFENGGKECYIVRVSDQADNAEFIGDSRYIKMGLVSLEDVDVNIICIPGITDVVVQQAALKHCESLKYRFCILDPAETADIHSLKEHRRHIDSSYGALYYPWLKVSGQSGNVVVMPPSGFIAGVYARIDAARGVHKAPANVGFNSTVDVLVDLDKSQQGILNDLHVNCLCSFPNRGVVIWGGRTLSSDPEWKYVPIRRLINHLEESIYQETGWVVFEPNAEPLWRTVESAVESFLYKQWRVGMLRGATSKEAFFVRCDRSTHTPIDIDNGRVSMLVGVAPLRPAEFVILKISQRIED